MKQFFKSTAFRCITVLLTVILICCIYLTLGNALLYVSPEERLNRAIAKIYQGERVESEAITNLTFPSEEGRANILEVRIVTSENHAGDYLVKSQGKDGFQNGTVTCWVVIETDSEHNVKGIGNVAIESNTNQSYISKVKNDFLEQFSATYNGDPFTTDNGFLASGASYSSNAICNAVNGAVQFVRQYLSDNGGVQ